MEYVQKVSDDIKKQQAIQERLQKEIIKQEHELVRLNDIPRHKRPVSFQYQKDDIVSNIKQLKKELSNAAQIANKLKPNLRRLPDKPITAKTMELVERGGEPTRRYLFEYGDVEVPGPYYKHPLPVKHHETHTSTHNPKSLSAIERADAITGYLEDLEKAKVAYEQRHGTIKNSKYK